MPVACSHACCDWHQTQSWCWPSWGVCAHEQGAECRSRYIQGFAPLLAAALQPALTYTLPTINYIPDLQGADCKSLYIRGFAPLLAPLATNSTQLVRLQQ